MRSIGGGAFPRQGKYERSEVGGVSEANGVILCVFQNSKTNIFSRLWMRSALRCSHTKKFEGESEENWRKNKIGGHPAGTLWETSNLPPIFPQDILCEKNGGLQFVTQKNILRKLEVSHSAPAG